MSVPLPTDFSVPAFVLEIRCIFQSFCASFSCMWSLYITRKRTSKIDKSLCLIRTSTPPQVYGATWHYDWEDRLVVTFISQLSTIFLNVQYQTNRCIFPNTQKIVIGYVLTCAKVYFGILLNMKEDFHVSPTPEHARFVLCSSDSRSAARGVSCTRYEMRHQT
jgi:hypothetical protein